MPDRERQPHEVSYELGGIKQSLDTITRTLSENRVSDALYRTDIRRELTLQNEAINVIVRDLGIAKRDITDMKPKVDSLDQRAMMSKGAAHLAILLGRFAHVISAAVGGIFAVIAERWLRGMPH
jgi:hypothetical protein